MRLGVFIGRLGFYQLAGFVIDIMVALTRTVDAVCPMQTGVEPLGRIRCGHLGGQHIAHFIVVGLRIGLGGKVTALPAPVCPRTCQTVENLLGRGFACLFNVRRRRRGFPKKLGHILFFDLFQIGRNARLPEVFLCDDVGCDLAPGCRDLNLIKTEHDGPVWVSNFRCRGNKF